MTANEHWGQIPDQVNFLEAKRKGIQNIASLASGCSKIMWWENYSSHLILAPMTNSFEDKLLRDHKNIHAYNCISKCSSVWPTFKQMSQISGANHFAEYLIVSAGGISET